jgi:gamma-glutamylcyclotransferase (GGCT)/AIG2-like uncharacterized protein YtfP
MFNQLCLFYGSLRQGEYNQKYFDYEFIRTVVLEGYKLYSLGSYPGIKKTNNPQDKLVCDLVRVSDENEFQSVDRMEIGAGYSREVVTLEEGEAILYIYDYNVREKDLVVHGDWTKRNEEIKCPLNYEECAE